MSAKLVELADSHRQAVSARIQAERLQTEVAANRHEVNVMEAHANDFEVLWADVSARPYRCNAKDILRGLNRWLSEQGTRTVSVRALSHSMRQSEIPDEMVDLIRRAEDMLA